MSILDLSATARPTMRVILPRRKRYFLSTNQKLDVFTPTKSTREMFAFLGNSLIKIGKKEATEDDFERLYEVTAKILSRNKQGVEITKADLEARVDTPDIIKILTEYANFLTAAIESKN